MHPLFISVLVMAATWDAWRWYVERVSAVPEEAAALALTVAFLGALGLLRRPKPAAPFSMPLLLVAVLLVAYAAGRVLGPRGAGTAGGAIVAVCARLPDAPRLGRAHGPPAAGAWPDGGAAG